ncbi:hypothetical protein BS78_09G121000 [Paspalum vaginatum]|nr:hypothetical protein BS78_09G121000 [Paspalum vaginatum]
MTVDPRREPNPSSSPRAAARRLLLLQDVTGHGEDGGATLNKENMAPKDNDEELLV